MPLFIWLMKHATDVLLIAPAAMGTILLIARVWDAISDPMVGYLSDRTTSRFGRRRSWVLGSALPIWLTLVMVWAPPVALPDFGLVVWVMIALLLFETAATAYAIPYYALGLELSSDYHERTRLFAWRHVISTFGYAGALLFVFLLRTADDSRQMAFAASLVVGALFVALVVGCVFRIPEPSAHQGRGGVDLWRSFRDVFSNPHARRLFVVFGIETFGMGVIGALGAYVMEDVVGRPDLFEWMLGAWMIPQFIFAPLWLSLSKRFGKKRLWLFGMGTSASAFLLLLFVGPNTWPLVFLAVMLIGVGSGIASVISPSVQADVVDFDELRSGERKEGAYTAVWNFIRKAGTGVASGAGGVALGVAGYDGALEVQPPDVIDTIRVGISVVPAAAYVLGIGVFSGFSLNEEEHSVLMAEIRARGDSGDSGFESGQ